MSKVFVVYRLCNHTGWVDNLAEFSSWELANQCKQTLFVDEPDEYIGIEEK